MGYESFLSGACGWVAVGSNIMPKEFALLFSFLIKIKFKEARSSIDKYYPLSD